MRSGVAIRLETYRDRLIISRNCLIEAEKVSVGQGMTRHQGREVLWRLREVVEGHPELYHPEGLVMTPMSSLSVSGNRLRLR